MPTRGDQSSTPQQQARPGRLSLFSPSEIFPFGASPFLILVLTVVAGVILAFHPVGGRAADLCFWTFARQHYDAYVNARPSFEARHAPMKLDIQVVHGDAVTNRLRAAFWADLDVPDVVEIEITRAGSFFRGGPEHIGFVDLRPYLERSGLIGRIVKTRLDPYTYRGRIYGLPHDVHPVMLGYRRDLFARLGIDASKLTTWEKFVEAGRRVTVRGERYMLNLSKTQSYSLEVFLFQRGGGYFNADGELIMDNAVATETLKWYVPLVEGDERIAADPGMFGQNFSKAVIDGYTLSFICPDWKSRSVERDMASLSGKMALMPMPAFEAGGRRTSTWGGTMLGITRKCDKKDLAWELAVHLYCNADDLARRFKDTYILPPVKDAWSHPGFHEPSAFWSGQRIGSMYIDLAEQVPAQYGSPHLELAKSKLGEVVAACVGYYERRGPEGFAAFAERRLKQAADEVRTQMKRNPF